MNTKTKIYIITAILIIVSALSVCLIIFQSYHNGGVWLDALCVVLLFASILILQFLWIDVPTNSFWTYNMRALAVIVLMIPIVYGLTKAENNFEELGLQAHGVTTKQAITYTYKTSGKNVGVMYNAVYQYEVNGETYTQKLASRHDIYKVGDTV